MTGGRRGWQEGKRQEVAETSEEAEAKRANHDFRNSPADSAVPTKDSPKTPAVSASAVSVKDLKPEEEVALEDSVSANIVLPLEKEGVVVAVAEVIPRPSPFGRKAFRKRKEVIRCVAREAVYRMLKEAKGEEVPPLRDKAPNLGWERLRWHAERVVSENGPLGEFWALLEEWVEGYFAENAIPIWRKLTERAGKGRTPSEGRRRRRR
ncbi:hypothetical protein PI124_g8309 [Phytophthora idaei]|nr:hypothetical protein PI124_g8309 [Phytophthora idaei]